jgi:flagellar hook-associated protein 2
MAGIALSGIASGVDTATIVDQLMALERRSSERLELRQSQANGRKADLTALKTKLAALKTAATDMRSASTWSQGQAVESSDPSRVVATRTGGAPIGGYSVHVLSLASAAQKTYEWKGATANTTLTLDDGDATTAPLALDIKAGATIADVAAQINGRGDAPVYAAVVGGDKLVLSSRTTGEDVEFSAASGVIGPATAEVPGRDASYVFNGEPEPRTSPTNVVETAIPGVTLTFKGITSDPASVVVGAPAVDKDKVKSAVKAFVEAYNGLVNATRAEVSEKRVANATTQSDAMKGLLFGDTALNGMLSRLRSGMGAAFSETGAAVSPATPDSPAVLDRLADLGISVGGKAGGSADAAKKGLLELDEDALDAALDKDVQGVRRLLGGTSTPGFTQSFESVADELTKVLDGRIDSAGREHTRLGRELTRVDERLAAKEKRMKAQFAAMELALSQSQTQQQWLSGQLAALTAQSSK